jgi:hypothetical protein
MKNTRKTAVFGTFSLYKHFLLAYDRIDEEGLKHFCLVLFVPVFNEQSKLAKCSSHIDDYYFHN